MTEPGTKLYHIDEHTTLVLRGDRPPRIITGHDLTEAGAEEKSREGRQVIR